MTALQLKPRQLSAFLAVAELRTFTQAAQRMHLTPSAISNLISELESALGFSLFERTTRRVALTVAGRKFLPSAIAIQRELDGAYHLAADIRNGTTEVVRVAAPMTIASVILPKLIASYRSQRPQTTVYVVDTGVEWLADRVNMGEADIAVGPDRTIPSNVLRTQLYRSDWVVWCAPQHELSKCRALCWSDLEGTTVFSAGRDYEHNVVPLLAEHGEYIRARSMQVVENFSTALGMAAAGLGITFSPDYVAPLASLLGLLMRPLRKPSIRRQVCLYEPRESRLSDAGTDFRNFLLGTLRADGRRRKSSGKRLRRDG